MSTPRLSLAVSTNPRTAPLRSGAVGIEGVDVDISRVHGSEMFWRQLKFGDFDVSEMSIATLLILNSAARETGAQLDWVPIPVFTSRKFFHAGALVRVGAGIDGPADLKGKRVGVPEYQQTAAVWTRGIFADDFDVHPRDLKWFMERFPEVSHAGSTGFTPPPDVSLERIDRTESIASKLLDGTLDATVLYLNDPNLVDRSRADLDNNPKVKPLFEDAEAEQHRYYAKWKMIPINHCVVVRRTLVEQYPWLVLNVYEAFNTARNQAYASMVNALEDYAGAGLIPDATLGVDLHPYGVKANQRELDTVMRYGHEQGLTKTLLTPADVFDKQTLDL